MSAVFREIAVEFGGKEYTFTPSNKLLRKIDAGLHPLTMYGLIGSMDGVQLPIYGIAYVASEFVKAGGGNISEDQMVGELYADLRDNKGEGVKAFIAAIGAAVTPEREGKN